jgi:hypothetical protein
MSDRHGDKDRERQDSDGQRDVDADQIDERGGDHTK